MIMIKRPTGQIFHDISVTTKQRKSEIRAARLRAHRTMRASKRFTYSKNLIGEPAILMYLSFMIPDVQIDEGK